MTSAVATSLLITLLFDSPTLAVHCRKVVAETTK